MSHRDAQWAQAVEALTAQGMPADDIARIESRVARWSNLDALLDAIRTPPTADELIASAAQRFRAAKART